MRALKLQRMQESARENIWLDPGIGFAKDTAQNIAVMQGLQEISEFRLSAITRNFKKIDDWKCFGLACRRTT